MPRSTPASPTSVPSADQTRIARWPDSGTNARRDVRLEAAAVAITASEGLHEQDASTHNLREGVSPDVSCAQQQGYEWFTEERVSIDDDLDLWMVQGSVDSITGYRPLGSYFIVETILNRDNPDSARIAEGLWGIASSTLGGTGVSRVEVEASNGNRLARCNVLG